MADGQRVNIGVRLLPHTVGALDAAGDRMGGLSRATVIEVLTALYASGLTASTQVPIGMVPVGARAKKKQKKGRPKADDAGK